MLCPITVLKEGLTRFYPITACNEIDASFRQSSPRREGFVGMGFEANMEPSEGWG